MSVVLAADQLWEILERGAKSVFERRKLGSLKRR
jgi:hypothetical protein